MKRLCPKLYSCSFIIGSIVFHITTLKTNVRQSSIVNIIVMPFLFVAGVFLYIFLRIQPALVYQCQFPPFLWEDTFFLPFLNFPGGPLDYLSHLLSQFLFYPIIGASILTLCLILTLLLSRTIVKTIAPAFRYSLIVYIPSILLLILLSQYEHRLTYTLAWLLSLFFIVLYLKSRSWPPFLRFGLYLLLAVFLYYAGAGFFLLFAIWAVLQEFLQQKNVILGLFYLVLMWGIPVLAQSIFVLTPQSAFFYLLLPIYDYRPSVTPYLLTVYFPLLLVLSRAGFFDWLNRHVFFRLHNAVHAAILLLFTGLAAIWSFDSTMYRVLKVDDLARQGKWRELLAFVDNHPSDDILVAFQTNRALYHVGRLTSEMFAYNQNWGLSGLYLPEEARKFFSIQVSDFYWDMGFLNEAEHWALEDHSNFFFSPRHVQRIATISILKGNKRLAGMCLDALDKTILYRVWAEDHRKFIDYPQLVQQNPRFVHLKNMNISTDFIITPAYPEQDMELFLAHNPENRAAFEFKMADYLLTFRLGEFVKTLQSTSFLNGPTLPRHYQEAVLVYLHSTQWQEQETLARGVDAQTAAQFNDFTRTLARYHGDAGAAQPELKEKYGHTYWYYSLYNNPSTREASS